MSGTYSYCNWLWQLSIQSAKPTVNSQILKIKLFFYLSEIKTSGCKLLSITSPYTPTNLHNTFQHFDLYMQMSSIVCCAFHLHTFVISTLKYTHTNRQMLQLHLLFCAVTMQGCVLYTVTIVTISVLSNVK